MSIGGKSPGDMKEKIPGTAKFFGICTISPGIPTERNHALMTLLFQKLMDVTRDTSCAANTA
jgi:hypothetical protein